MDSRSVVQAWARFLGRVARYATLQPGTVIGIWAACILLSFVGVLRFNQITDTNQVRRAPCSCVH